MTARHQQVADDLRRLIASGMHPAGERLPSESRLAARYHVSTPTLRDALELLRAEGLIEKFQGRGNYVRLPSDRLTYPGSGGNDLHVQVSWADISASGELATRLRISPDTPITEYTCLSHRADSPQCVAHIYVPHTASRAHDSPVGVSPWGDDILTAAVSAPLTSTDQVTARFPSAAEAQSLRIGARTPVLAVQRTVAADDGHIVAFSLLVLPGDRAEVAFLTRINTKAEAP
ncbi:GntR family transcriptional regulator [Streptomyces sp. NBC_01476]|uniref:GntR family transcriptional regulator n=1 Tax=Streptomyces sp. NBC_01476 TaxID=2903881 RepID=UPI002E2ED323|nr:GntR family transcriptional regulator [Streptomyces sp. NBC_01476]